MKKLFSLSNIELILAASHVFIYRLSYLLSFLCLCLLCFNIYNPSVLILFFILLLILSLITHGASKTYIYSLNYSYITSFCILQLFYIYQDLSNDSILRDMKLKKLVKRRIEKLSKLFYLLGKFEQDKLGNFTLISKNIMWRKSWLNSPRDTTINDLYNYFRQITYCLVVGKSGNLPIDNPSVYGENSVINWQHLTINMDRSISFTQKIIVLVKSIKEIFVFIKSFFL